MARINRISITLCALLLTTLPFTPMAHASKQARTIPTSTHSLKTVDKKEGATTSQETTKISRKTTTKTTSKTSTKTASSSKKRATTPVRSTRTANHRGKTAVTQAAAAIWAEKCTSRRGHKPRCVKAKTAASTTLVDTYKVEVQKTTKTAMSTLVNWIGKPYRQDGSSPKTESNCSGLAHYAYKDLVKSRTPRVTNEMYYLCDVAPIEHGELKDGGLVFFRTQGCGTTDHVGVYVGNGKFIQSPRSGQEIQITSLSEDCWQRHYVDARRVMTPKAIR